MPLTACPECERRVSTRATRCPGCGSPIAETQPTAPSTAADAKPQVQASIPSGQRHRSRPATRLYSDGQIRAATFFGTILAGSHLIAANWHRLGRPEAAPRTRLVGIATFVVALGLAQILPDKPAGQAGLACTLIYLAVAERMQKTQRPLVTQRTAEDAQLAGAWAVFGITLCYLAVAAAVVALTLL